MELISGLENILTQFYSDEGRTVFVQKLVEREVQSKTFIRSCIYPVEWHGVMEFCEQHRFYGAAACIAEHVLSSRRKAVEYYERAGDFSNAARMVETFEATPEEVPSDREEQAVDLDPRFSEPRLKVQRAAKEEITDLEQRGLFYSACYVAEQAGMKKKAAFLYRVAPSVNSAAGREKENLREFSSLEETPHEERIPESAVVKALESYEKEGKYADASELAGNCGMRERESFYRTVAETLDAKLDGGLVRLAPSTKRTPMEKAILIPFPAARSKTQGIRTAQETESRQRWNINTLRGILSQFYTDHGRVDLIQQLLKKHQAETVSFNDCTCRIKWEDAIRVCKEYELFDEMAMIAEHALYNQKKAIEYYETAGSFRNAERVIGDVNMLLSDARMRGDYHLIARYEGEKRPEEETLSEIADLENRRLWFSAAYTAYRAGMNEKGNLLLEEAKEKAEKDPKRDYCSRMIRERERERALPDPIDSRKGKRKWSKKIADTSRRYGMRKLAQKFYAKAIEEYKKNLDCINAAEAALDSGMGEEYQELIQSALINCEVAGTYETASKLARKAAMTEREQLYRKVTELMKIEL